jgi:hypothetical protein
MRLFVCWAAMCLWAAGPLQAQNRTDLAPYSAAAAQYKSIQLDKAFSAFRTGALHGGLLLLADISALDPEDQDVNRLYRLNCNRFAMRISEDCDMTSTFANCDSALKYVQMARKLGDSSMYHEVMALALYQKVLHLSLLDFNLYRDQMPARMLTQDMAYRYLPEERKIFYKDLLNTAIEHIAVARGELDRKDKIAELTGKLKVIERSQRIIGTR